MNSIIIEGTSEGVHVVKHKDVNYRLRGAGWNRTRFEFLKREARGHAKLILLDGDKPFLAPIIELEWVQ